MAKCIFLQFYDKIADVFTVFNVVVVVVVIVVISCEFFWQEG